MGINFEFVFKEVIENVILLGGIRAYQITIFNAIRHESIESVTQFRCQS